MLDRSSSNLVSDIWSGIADIAIHLPHDANMFVRIEETILLLSLSTWSIATETGLVGLETGIGEDNDQALRVFIGGRDRNVLLSRQLREGWRWCRLGS
jgi:hypothetical protein